MEGKCDLIIYNYCSIYDATVFERDIIIDEAGTDWELIVTVKNERLRNSVNSTEIWTVDNGKIERVNDTTWKIKERKEHLKPDKYSLLIEYKAGDLVRPIIKGFITVKSK